MKLIRNWVVGICLLLLFPFLVPLAVFWALVYKIPATIGGVIFGWLGVDRESNN